MNRIRFTKMHGCGNDYIYVDAAQFHVSDPARAAVLWSDRHKGIGADGLVLIGRSPVAEADFSMRIFNADGSEAMMCGNASRCIGKYVYERGLTTKTSVRLLTLSGIKTLRLQTSGASVEAVSVDMGSAELADERLFLPHRGLRAGTFVSMGNPHYVIFSDDVDQVAEAGRVLERHPAFPQRCNIEFARVVEPACAEDLAKEATDETTIRVRVWERGSGITQACGTGACAAAVAALLTGRARRRCRIMMDGGELGTEIRQADGHVLLSGGAEVVFDGEIVDEV